ncbi:MAG: phosphoribosyltransferase [Deinococcales bacterium]|jgi:hypoxanthine phosphoribosyltransferase
MATSTSAVPLAFDVISHRLHALDVPEVDVVVGIATGGTVPAALLAHQLERPLSLVTVNFRAPDNTPQRPAPEVLGPVPALEPGSRVLLVDEVSVTGATLEAARALFPGQLVTTLVLKGRADLVAFPEIDTCVAWPWKG